MKNKPKRVIGYSKRSALPYIYVEETLSPTTVLVSTSKGWPQVWMVDRSNIDFVLGGEKFVLPHSSE